MIAPIVGSTLDGWITDSYSWRWVFLINAPVGLLALAGCYFLLREPDYLIAQRAKLRKQPFRFDSIGLSLLPIVIVCREVMLSKGQEVGLAGRSVLAHPDARQSHKTAGAIGSGTLSATNRREIDA